jgi:hypothetical protein
MSDLATQIRLEVEAGLPNERDRLRDSWDNRRFADGHFEEYPTRPENSAHERLDYRRTSPIMGRIVEILSSKLYKASPTRQLAGNPAASEWLERVYRKNHMLPKWQEADRLTFISDLCAFQFSGDDDPLAPVRIDLWAADQLVWWLDPEDCTRPAAVGTIDRYDARRRLTIWTKELRSVYLTDKEGARATSGGTAFRKTEETANPYVDPSGLGVIPFSFCHYKFPACEFHQRGPGNGLRQLNDYVNYDIDDIADGKRYLSKPMTVATGVSAEWTPPARIRPGMWIKMEAGSRDVSGDFTVPTLGFLTADGSWIPNNWMDLNNYIDHELEMHGVPPGTIRLSASVNSGVQVIAEQEPIITVAERRQTPFSDYEADAARVCVLVARSHLMAHGHAVPAELDAAAEDPSLSVTWPQLRQMLPGPEKNSEDEYRLTMGLCSKLDLLMERDGLTREQALERFRQIVADNAELAALGIDPLPPASPAIAGQTGPNAMPAGEV